MVALIYLYLEPFKLLNEAFWEIWMRAQFTCATVDRNGSVNHVHKCWKQNYWAVLKQKLMAGLISIKVCALSFE